jgi:hypothetical protein
VCGIRARDVRDRSGRSWNVCLAFKDRRQFGQLRRLAGVKLQRFYFAPVEREMGLVDVINADDVGPRNFEGGFRQVRLDRSLRLRRGRNAPSLDSCGRKVNGTPNMFTYSGSNRRHWCSFKKSGFVALMLVLFLASGVRAHNIHCGNCPSSLSPTVMRIGEPAGNTRSTPIMGSFAPSADEMQLRAAAWSIGPAILTSYNGEDENVGSPTSNPRPSRQTRYPSPTIGPVVHSSL